MKRSLLFTSIYSILLIALLPSCKEKTRIGLDRTIWVYKTTKDYSDKVPVEISQDKSKVTSFPGPNDVDSSSKPIKLIYGYYMNGSRGKNTAYLSLSIEEYSKYEYALGPDSLYKLIIDKDPFIEFWSRDDYDNKFANDNDNGASYGIDTALINDLIIKSELNKYFSRLK